MNLPSGPVTFLFTDVEGSSRLWETERKRMRRALGRHDALLRDAIGRHGGHVFKTVGDAFCAAFADPVSALTTALEAQRSLTGIDMGSGGRLRVRMALHTGTVEERDGDYFGPPLNRVARLLAATHGGQVVLTAATRELIADALPAGCALRDLGQHRLRDLTRAEHVFELTAPDLECDFPPLKTLSRTNLPIQPTPLIGRKRELSEAGALLRSSRLLTLTGPGGSGKTRLALQLARHAADAFPDGVFWVPLQAVRDPEIVGPTIGRAVGADGSLREHMADQRLLLLLDNFEQIVEAAPLISGLLAAAPHVRVLVTSREPLHLESERRYPLEPLPDVDAAALFLERARSVVPDFSPTAAVTEICRKLDGLPLAIELAAARTALLDPEQLLARLERRLPLLTSRSREVPERQRTLRGAIDWSYELLTEHEQLSFRRLAAFAGGFTLEGAEAVCGTDFDALESLVEKSLVRRWGNGRFGMLETIHEYALERLEQSEEAADLRLRHAEFFLEVARKANLSASNLAPGGQRLDLAIVERDNMRLALAWCLESGRVTLGLAIASALEQFWVTENPAEGMRWFRSLLEHPGAEGTSAELRALALLAYGSSADIGGEDETADRVYGQSLTLYEQVGDQTGRAALLHRLAIQALRRGDSEEARRYIASCEQIPEWTRHPWGQAQIKAVLGAIDRDTGDDERASRLISESLELARETRVPWWEAGMLAELAQLALNAGRTDEAGIRARNALSLAEELRDRAGCVFGVGLIATVAAERGEPERAGILWGAIATREAGAPLGGWRRHRGECEMRLRKAAGPEFDRGYAEGRTWTLDEAVEYALSEKQPSGQGEASEG